MEVEFVSIYAFILHLLLMAFLPIVWLHTAILSLMLCIVAKRYVLQQKCLNIWIESVLLETWQYHSQPPTLILSPQSAHPKISNPMGTKKNAHIMYYAYVTHM